jgi:hypothetical protein
MITLTHSDVAVLLAVTSAGVTALLDSASVADRLRYFAWQLGCYSVALISVGWLMRLIHG